MRRCTGLPPSVALACDVAPRSSAGLAMPQRGRGGDERETKKRERNIIVNKKTRFSNLCAFELLSVPLEKVDLSIQFVRLSLSSSLLSRSLCLRCVFLSFFSFLSFALVASRSVCLSRARALSVSLPLSSSASEPVGGELHSVTRWLSLLRPGLPPSALCQLRQ